jgi:hypothetical protein
MSNVHFFARILVIESLAIFHVWQKIQNVVILVRKDIFPFTETKINSIKGIGICGEPCPSQCRICNKQLVQEYFFGNEDKSDSCFVNLPDCDHLCEVYTLISSVFNSLFFS